MNVDIRDTGIAPDPKGNVELVRFGSTAILFCGGDEPFMVVKGYDRKTGEWQGDPVCVDDLPSHGISPTLKSSRTRPSNGRAPI